MLGATVIGTVSTKLKALQANEDGCHHVIIYKEEDIITRVAEMVKELMLCSILWEKTPFR
ncbi:putative 2-haloacrylate reductase [Helianthus annuus]|nr:putative 2-haloacrylate reductase [Helianthus annuus]